LKFNCKKEDNRNEKSEKKKCMNVKGNYCVRAAFSKKLAANSPKINDCCIVLRLTMIPQLKYFFSWVAKHITCDLPGENAPLSIFIRTFSINQNNLTFQFKVMS
jgi:hypothetical protein